MIRTRMLVVKKLVNCKIEGNMRNLELLTLDRRLSKKEEIELSSLLNVEPDDIKEIAYRIAHEDGCSKFVRSLWQKKQGYVFESWLVEKLSTKYQLIEWSCDKFDANSENPSKKNPDLVFKIKDTGRQIVRFAIECKWHEKKEENDSNVFVAYKGQIKNYREYVKKKKNLVPVFIAIGYGKDGTAIDELSIIPLKQIKVTKSNERITITREKFERYKINDFNKIEFDRKKREVR